MREEGKIISGGRSSGTIETPGGDQVSYTKATVRKGGMPRFGEKVCFVRDPVVDPLIATAVWRGTCAAVKLAEQLTATFSNHATAAGGSHGQAVLSEINRLAAQRAKRILRPASGADPLPSDLLAARIALAEATMLLLETELRTLKGTTAEHVRAVLRRQRPTLPR